MRKRRRHWHPTLVLLPGKSHGRRSLEGGSPWGRWGSDTTDRLHFHFSLSCIGEGNGNPLQCSCLENPRGRGAWWAAVYGVAQSRTRLKWLSSSSNEKEGRTDIRQELPASVQGKIPQLSLHSTQSGWGRSAQISALASCWIQLLLVSPNLVMGLLPLEWWLNHSQSLSQGRVWGAALLKPRPMHSAACPLCGLCQGAEPWWPVRWPLKNMQPNSFPPSMGGAYISQGNDPTESVSILCGRKILEQKSTFWAAVPGKMAV